MKKKGLYGILAFYCILFLSGCATGLVVVGPAFQPVSNIPNDKAVVYIYWPEEYYYLMFPNAGSQAKTQYTLTTNGIELGTLLNGGYFAYLAEPGSLELTEKVQFKFGATGTLDVLLTPEKNIIIDVGCGKNYYIRCSLDAPSSSFSLVEIRPQNIQMVHTSKTLGSAEIQSCVLLE